MKKSAILLLLILPCIIHPEPDIKTILKNHGLENKPLQGAHVDAALKLLKRFDPEGFYLVESCRKAPTSFRFPGGKSIMVSDTTYVKDFNENSTPQQILSSLDVLVHECCHGFTSRISLVLQEKLRRQPLASCAYPVEQRRVVLVPQQGVFPSRLAHNMVPETLRQGRFSYYFSPSRDSQGTQKMGIYGLLDEWNAYYHGIRTSVHVAEIWLEQPGGQDVWLKGLTNIYSCLAAHWEFKIYILMTLEYARLHRPDDYEKIINNAAFRTAYRGVKANWERILPEIGPLRERLVSEIRKRGEVVVMKNHAFMDWVPGGKGSGPHYERLLPLFTFADGPLCRSIEAALLSDEDDQSSLYRY